MKSCITKNLLNITVIGSILAVSCASTPKQQSVQTGAVETTAAIESAAQAPAESELYSKKIEGINLTLLSSPKETAKGKIFASPYIIKAEKTEGLPVENYEITVIYPSERKLTADEDSGSIIFAETVITTDSEGKAEFLPPVPEFSFNSEITFFPKYNKEGIDEAEISKIEKLASEKTIKSPFKVQTNQKSTGGIIALVDFNQNEKAITSNPISSSNLLMTLMKLGFVKIGNAPQNVIDAVIQNSNEKIFSRSKSIAQSFIIFGTVKISSYEKSDAGFTYTLTGTVKSMDSKTGMITFQTEKSITVTDKNDWNALANARKSLAEQIATEIKYGI